MIDRIEWQGKTLALIMRNSYDIDGVNFITSEENLLQLGTIKQKAGTRITPHVHKNQNITPGALF